ncbi:MAG: FAD-dependent oxidoreductase [Pseudomonadota bacterium]
MVSNAANSKPDLTIIGGGIVGLWSARIAARQGLSVHLVEKRTLGAGASGGMLGALMPHHPGGWSAKKQFQLDGLLALPGLVTELEDETSIDCGYGRVGRIQPIGHAQKRQQSAVWVDGAQDNWPAEVHWTITDDHPAPGWADEIAQHGWNCDSLSARINPRALIAALSKSVRADPAITATEGQAVDALPETAPTIIAAGLGSFALINPQAPETVGKGVKGQGALLRPNQTIETDQPIIYDNGTYVIAHADGTVAVGSTSENSYADPTSTDEKLDAIIEDARRICPHLRHADVIERWADVRPKAGKPDPMLGPLPGQDNIIVATGGFKISFAIAHLMGQAAVNMATGQPAPVPEAFLPATRLT